MRLAAISDVHGNRPALEAVLDDIARQGPDLTVNLGDLVSGPIDPAGTLELLRGAGFLTIRGNHERWLQQRPDGELDAVDRFVRQQLTPAQINWLGQLPATMEVAAGIFLCHGTPRSDVEPWLDNWWVGRETTLPDEAAVSARAPASGASLLLCGHTHLPRAVRLRDGRQIVNPGSVGLQIAHGSPDARYAVLERGRGGWAVSLRAVPYDCAHAARLAEEQGFARWGEALRSGWTGPEGLF